MIMTYMSMLNPQMNSQKMRSSSYWKCSSTPLQQQSLIGTGHRAVPTCPLLCLPAQSKARVAVLKDANDFLPLNAVNANILTFMHNKKTVEVFLSFLLHSQAKSTSQSRMTEKVLSSAENPTEASKFNRKFQS